MTDWDRAEAAERKVRALQDQVKDAHDCILTMAVDATLEARRYAAQNGASDGQAAHYHHGRIDAYVAGLVFLTREGEPEIRARVEKAADKERDAKAAGERQAKQPVR